jgi:hypothetical protein
MLPNMVPSNNRRTLGHSYNNSKNKQSHSVLSVRNVVTFLAVAVPCFFLGTLSSLYTGVVQCSDNNPHQTGLRPELASSVKTSSASEEDITARVADKVRSLQMEMQADQTVKVDALVEERLAVLMRQHNVECATPTVDTRLKPDGTKDDPMMHQVNEIVAERLALMQKEMDAHCGETESSLWPIDKVGHFISGMARTTKEAFTSQLDLGVPIDKFINGSSDVLLIYNNKKSLPKAIVAAGADKIPDLSMQDAVENCDYLNVVLTHHTPGREQCIAIVPQYESYHVQKWMRINNKGALDKRQKLQKVNRGHQSNGREAFNPPTLQDTSKQWDMLRGYLDTINEVLDDLEPILNKIAVKKTVIVMVCNFGQAELLMNFVCSAKARGFDISNILVFATDQETLDLAESIGLTAYFDKRVRTARYDMI